MNKKLFNRKWKLLTFFILVCATVFTGSQMIGKSSKQIKIVYHISADSQADNAIRNMNNHLKADKTVKIVLVAHSSGIDFLLQGAKDDKGALFADRVLDLQVQGVEFRVCNNTLTSRKIDPSKVISEVKIVPSGVAEVAKLQANEGFVYIKP